MLKRYTRIYYEIGKTSAKNFRNVALCKRKTDSRNSGIRLNTSFLRERETGIEPATPTLARLTDIIQWYTIVPQNRINTSFLQKSLYYNIRKIQYRLPRKLPPFFLIKIVI